MRDGLIKKVSGERLEYSLEAAHELASLHEEIATAMHEEADFAGPELIRRTRAMMIRSKALISMLQDSLGDAMVSDDQIKLAFGRL